MGLPASRMRFIALSATLPNAMDIGTFIEAEVFRFGPEYRPVPLEVHTYINEQVIYVSNTYPTFVGDLWIRVNNTPPHAHLGPNAVRQPWSSKNTWCSSMCMFGQNHNPYLKNTPPSEFHKVSFFCAKQIAMRVHNVHSVLISGRDPLRVARPHTREH